MERLFYETSYSTLTVLTISYFLGLYFGVGLSYLWICKRLTKAGYAKMISAQPVSKRQIAYEIRHSLYSIIIFGFSTLPIAHGIRHGYIGLSELSIGRLAADLLILTVWNEIHFYVIHRVLHHPFLMRHIHRVHHRSATPTVFSVYSFHVVESALLSTVLMCIAPFYDFTAAALMSFPLVSILINLSGHSNYRLKLPETAPSWLRFVTKHHDHHSKTKSVFGFMMPFMDSLFTRNLKK
jgi:Delta7-sterol 5-desaturase